MNKALFLDRDGVLNIDKGYTYKWEEIVWFDEIFSLMKLAKDKNYKIIILTNQSGVGRGMYTREDVENLHQKMNDFLKSKNISITDWFYCPDLESENRKPRPGMLLAAQKKYNLNLEHSIMVGDKISDIFETNGLFIRPKTFLIKGNYDLSMAEKKGGVVVLDSHHELLVQLEKIMF